LAIWISINRLLVWKRKPSMAEFYDILPLYQRFHQLCKKRGILLDPELGDHLSFQGKTNFVAASRGDTLVLIDEMVQIPLDDQLLIYLENWEENPACFLIPRFDWLLQIIYQHTSLFPTMTPGVRSSQNVWQVVHPSAPPIVGTSLEQCVLELGIRILETEPKDIEGECEFQ